MDRILPTHFNLGAGVQYAQLCGFGGAVNPNSCVPEYRGQLQPYAVYIPARATDRGRYGLTLLLHSLSANYNQFIGSRNQVSVRQPAAELDHHHHRVARPRSVLPGGRRRRGVRGVGRHRPPLPARPGLQRHRRLLDGRLRHVPARRPVPGPVRPRPADGRRGVRQRRARLAAQPPPADVEQPRRRARQPAPSTCPTRSGSATSATATSSTPSSRASRTPGAHRCSPATSSSRSTTSTRLPPPSSARPTSIPNPPHVTYVDVPSRNRPDLGLNGDHAYWVSAITAPQPGQNGPGGQPMGEIDAFSHGFGRRRPAERRR